MAGGQGSLHGNGGRSLCVWGRPISKDDDGVPSPSLGGTLSRLHGGPVSAAMGGLSPR